MLDTVSWCKRLLSKGQENKPDQREISKNASALGMDSGCVVDDDYDNCVAGFDEHQIGSH